jgi:hypothetical protein
VQDLPDSPSSLWLAEYDDYRVEPPLSPGRGLSDPPISQRRGPMVPDTPRALFRGPLASSGARFVFRYHRTRMRETTRHPN